jgi:ferredoxin
VVTYHLRVNPVDCAAPGLCAELLPERVTLDDWGYPIIDTVPVSEDLVAHAKRAVAACPVFALKLDLVASDRSRRAGRAARSKRSSIQTSVQIRAARRTTTDLGFEGKPEDRGGRNQCRGDGQSSEPGEFAQVDLDVLGA